MRLTSTHRMIVSLASFLAPTIATATTPFPMGHGVSVESMARAIPAISSDLMVEMARRSDCEQMGKVVAWPTRGEFGATIEDLISPAKRSLYLRAQESLWGASRLENLCRDRLWGIRPVDASRLSGLEHFANAAVESDPSMTRLNIVLVGGLGSRFFNSRVFGHVVTGWEGKSVGTTRVPIRVTRWSCTKYASDNHCAPELSAALGVSEAVRGGSNGDRYIFFGYSQGGLTSLETIYSRRDVRDRTLAVVTLGSPIGGSPMGMRLLPLLDRVEAKFGKNMTLAKAIALGVIASVLGEDASAFIEARLDMDLVREAYSTLLPETRQKFLEGEFARRDYRRSNGTSVPVYHVAGVVDLARMPNLPKLTVDAEGWTVPVMNKSGATSLAEASWVRDFNDYPFSDTVVPLQSAVIPANAMPVGLKSELIGMINVDHSSMGFGGVLGTANDPVGPAVGADSIFEVLAKRLDAMGGK